MSRVSSCVALALCVCAGAISSACTYRRVEEKGGIEAALKADSRTTTDWEGLLSVGTDAEDRALSEEEATSLRRTDEDGRVTLVARSPAHVMFHLTQTLSNQEYDLLLDQVLSDATKTEYRRRGLDPMEAVEYLIARQADIMQLFASMPLGDQTPGVSFETIGPNMFRLSPPAAIAHELRFRQFDVIIERREFRLLMIR